MDNKSLTVIESLSCLSLADKDRLTLGAVEAYFSSLIELKQENTQERSKTLHKRVLGINDIRQDKVGIALEQRQLKELSSFYQDAYWAVPAFALKKEEV